MEHFKKQGPKEIIEEMNFSNLAENYFEKIEPSTLNTELLIRILEIPELTSRVVKMLEREESADNWPLKDEDIKQFIKLKCISKGIPLPQDQDQLKRWFCLIYMVSALAEGFSYGNVVRVCDITGEEEDY